MKITLKYILMIFLLLKNGLLWSQIPQTLSYQGVLTDNDGNPVSDGQHTLIFKFFDTAYQKETALWSETHSVSTKNGIFNVIMGSQNPIDIEFDKQLWLEISVPDEPPMSPRIQITASAYSLSARGVIGTDNIFPSQGNVGIGTFEPKSSLEVNGTIHSTFGGFKFPDGTVQSSAISGTAAWNLDGNSGTSSGTHFLGTTDEQSLEIRVHNHRILNLEPHATSPNILGGYHGNLHKTGIHGVTISGGGQENHVNMVTAEFGTVGGGYANIAAAKAVVGGGSQNQAVHPYTTIGGGEVNQAGGRSATIAGGTDNRAMGERSTIPGGYQNAARENYSFAAGYKAKAMHKGAFVWSDNSSSDSTFTTGDNQFIIRAAGGVGINEMSPSALLSIRAGSMDEIPLLAFNDVAGDNLYYFEGNFAGSNSSGNWLVMKDHWGNTIQTWRNRCVGIGTQDPKGKLDVNGTIYQRGSALHADYVFNKDYRLESIEEHAAFMWQNKHLQAIPKRQVDENGNEIVEMGAHQKGIVEELEKAHIYIEQLHKRIQVLEEKIDHLSSKN